jgi:hypothetical protein
MKRLLPLLAWMLCVSAAFAEPGAPLDTKRATSALVEEQLLLPLKKAEAKRSRFSRAAPVTLERRLRVLDAAALTDARGKAFVRFAIDERRFADQGAWTKDSVLGCAYLNEQEVFVRRGRGYLPARSMLGKEAEERPGACQAVPASGAAVGRAQPFPASPGIKS